jgi:hypothetical protein
VVEEFFARPKEHKVLQRALATAPICRGGFLPVFDPLRKDPRSRKLIDRSVARG